MRKKSKRIFSLLVSMLFVMQLGINPVITYADVNNEDAEKLITMKVQIHKK